MSRSGDVTARHALGSPTYDGAGSRTGRVVFAAATRAAPVFLDTTSARAARRKRIGGGADPERVIS